MYTMTTNYGFTTAIQLRLHSGLTRDRAQEAGAGVQAFLHAHAKEVEHLAGVTVHQAPSVMIDGTIVTLPLQLHTGRDLSFADKLALARNVAAYVREAVDLPEIAEVVDGKQPSIATVGW